LVAITRNLNWPSIRDTLIDTVKITGMMFFMLWSAVIFVIFMNVSGLPQLLAHVITDYVSNVYVFLAGVAVLFIILGMFMPTVSILLVTLPVLFPLLNALNIDLIWFGILFLKLSELGAITPPFALSIFVVKSIVGDTITTGTIMRGILWFAVMDIVTIAILIIWPQISLWLPNMAFG